MEARSIPARFVAVALLIALLLAAPGLLLAWRRDRLAFLVLVLPLLATVATALVFYGSVRFRQSVAAFYVIPAALAASALWGRLRGERAAAD